MSKNEKDITEKILFEMNDVFADVINVLIFKGKQVIKPEDLQTDGSISQLKIASKIHFQERDVSKFWMQGGLVFSLLGIENQTMQDKDMPLRIIAYDGAAYKAQVNQHNATERVQENPEGKAPVYPVVSIVLYFGTKHWTKPTSLLDCIEVDIPDELKPFVNDYHAHVIEVAFLDDETINMFRSDFRFVADYFVQKRKYGDKFHPAKCLMTHVHETLSFFQAATGSKRFKEVYEELREQGRDKKGEVSMCEVMEMIEKKAKTESEEKLMKIFCEMVYNEGFPIKKAIEKTQVSEEEFMVKMHELYPDFKPEN